MTALLQKSGPSFSRGAAVPASMLMSTSSAVPSPKLLPAAATDPALSLPYKWGQYKEVFLIEINKAPHYYRLI